MFFVFSFVRTCAAAKSSFYNLEPPFMDTNVSEIGNWTYGGTATNLKQKIRLTSALPSLSGSLCQRIPFVFDEWSVDFSVSIKDGNGGDSFYFIFAKQLCPNLDTKLDGFAFWADLTSTNKEGKQDIYFSRLNNQSIKEAYTDNNKVENPIKIRSNESSRFIVSKRYDFVSVDFFNGNDHKQIVSSEMSDLITTGYLSFFAQTNKNSYDNIDINKVDVWPLNRHYYKAFESTSSSESPDYSSLNRKKLQKSPFRTEMKEKRRSQMPLMMKLNQEIREVSAKLNATERQNLSNAIKLVDEAYQRAQDTISLVELESMIENKIDPVITTALNKIKLASSKLDEYKDDLDAMYQNLESTMRTLVTNTSYEMNMIMVQILVSAKNLKVSKLDVNETTPIMERASHKVMDSAVTLIIAVISIIELVAYVIFFIRKRRYIENKLD